MKIQGLKNIDWVGVWSVLGFGIFLVGLVGFKIGELVFS